MTELAARVALIKATYDNCFGCGRTNPIGLQLDGFTLQNGTLATSFRPRAEYRGFDDALHGGIVATALDEMMAWAAILTENVMVVTAKMELRYRSPVPPDATLDLSAQVADRSGRRLRIESRCSHGTESLAEAKGAFLVTHELDV